MLFYHISQGAISHRLKCRIISPALAVTSPSARRLLVCLTARRQRTRLYLEIETTLSTGALPSTMKNGFRYRGSFHAPSVGHWKRHRPFTLPSIRKWWSCVTPLPPICVWCESVPSGGGIGEWNASERSVPIYDVFS